MGRRENIRRAKDIIAANRNISISEYENHVAEVSSAYPEFKRITTLLAGTGPRIMAASLGKMLEEDSIESIRAEYEALAEQKRRFLVSHGYPEDYCDIKYRCEKCSDTGYVGIKICDCLKKEIVSATLENSGLYSLIATQTFDTFSLDYYRGNERFFMEQNLKILKDFASSFTPGKSDNFIFLGATGLGKTHLSSSVAQAVIANGYYVVYESALTMFSDYEEKKFGRSSYYDADYEFDKYVECDLLLIDDLGCEMTNSFIVSCLYNVINMRLIQHKSTIISTNLNKEELRKRYSDRIISRIFGDYKPLIFRGSDIREQKIRQTI